MDIYKRETEKTDLEKQRSRDREIGKHTGRQAEAETDERRGRAGQRNIALSKMTTNKLLRVLSVLLY